MGSRGVLIVCRDEQVGLERFGRRALGECYSRTGRPFFQEERKRELLERLAAALSRAGIFE
ncbi:hypothetical protein HY251_16845, partial [bacterium]|nr:hypothetical protein [bacterium]